MERPMGFIRKDAGDATEETRRSPIILPIDAGGGLTSGDFNHHAIAFGSTGSGKTTNFLLPAVSRFIAEGHTTVVLTVKSSLAPQVLELARNAGRIGDVKIYGTSRAAERLNVFEDMSDSEVYRFFDALSFAEIRGQSHNYDFHAKGNRQAADAAILFRYLRRVFPFLVPTPVAVYETLNNPQARVRLWKYFKDYALDPKDKRMARFADAVESNPYHVLNEPSDDRNNRNKRSVDSKSRNEQLGYILGVIRSALHSFIEAPGIVEHFANPEGRGLNMERLLDDNNVAIIEFEPACGFAGAAMGRVLLNQIYRAIIKKGKKLPAGRKVCVAIDEFQTVADLSGSAWSDSSFVSIAREYNGVFLAATQSLAALTARSASTGEADSLISNCNSRLSFYTDDPLTQEMARRHDLSIDLTRLEPGQAFMVRYNNETRRHAAGLATFQKAYDETMAIVADAGDTETEEWSEEREGLDLIDLLDKVEEGKNALDAERDKKRTEEIMGKTAKRAASEEKLEKSWDEAAKRVFNEEGFENGRDDAGDSPDAPTDARIDADEEPTPRSLAKMFPEYFESADETEIEIPAGWRDLVARIFLAFSKTGLPLSISSLKPRSGVLYASTAESYGRSSSFGGSREILNALLRATANRCMICGEIVKTASGSRRAGENLAPLCDDCLRRFDIEPPAINNDDSEEDEEYDSDYDSDDLRRE